MTDLDFMGYRRVILKSDKEPSIVALCDAVNNGWHGEIVPEESPKGESKSNGEAERADQSVRGSCENSQRLFGGNNMESRWSLEVRCWHSWLSIVPIFSYSSITVDHTMATQPTCV